jgi:hypothetical protein
MRPTIPQGKQPVNKNQELVIRPCTLNCIARWKTGYTVTSLSLNNLAGYKSVTRQLHGYIIVNQQLSLQIGNIPATDPQHFCLLRACGPKCGALECVRGRKVKPAVVHGFTRPVSLKREGFLLLFDSGKTPSTLFWARTARRADPRILRIVSSCAPSALKRKSRDEPEFGVLKK